MSENMEKLDYLKQSGTFNSKYSDVSDELFQKNNFFDPCDLVQVKYEMLRKVDKEGFSVKDAINLFGMSRPNYYKVKTAFDLEGMRGLLPKKRGPRSRFKLTDDIIEFINRILEDNPSLTKPQITQKIISKFNVSIHPRTIERFHKEQKKSGKER